MKKTILSLSVLLGLSTLMVSNAHAQWSVIDVNSNSMQRSLEDIKSGVGGTIQELTGVRQGQEAQIKQVDQYQEDTDKRIRLSNGQNETLRRDLDALPTVYQCAEMTTRTANSSGVHASLSGGGGGRGVAGSLANYQSKITSTATAQAGVLDSVRSSLTCGGGMDDAIAGCGGAMPYAGADVYMYGLKNNTASRDPATGIMNLSLTAEGFKAAEANAKVATMYGAPPEIEMDKVRKNPSYVAVYKSVMSKLNASYQALIEVANLRRAPAALPPGIAGQKWIDSKADYQATMGITAPPVPSFFEALNFAVMRDYAGPVKPKENEAQDAIKLTKELNDKMVLSNVIAIQQLKYTETTNILLAHLLAQNVTPVNVENVRAEAAKTRNMN